MKLDHDCARDLLLALEEQLVLEPSGEISRLDMEDLYQNERLKKYEQPDIFYALQKLAEAGFVKASPVRVLSSLGYFFEGEDGITFEGHRYLDALRSDTVWARVKKKLKAIGGSAPFGMVLNLAEEYLKQSMFGSG